MRKTLLAITVFFIVSCNQEEKSIAPEADSSEIPASALPASAVSCYEWTGNNDTIKVRLEISGGEVSGTIVYDYFQKDRNEGALKGKLEGDVILADYSFDSEGRRSVRQVAFKRSGNDIIEGFGSMEEVNGKMIFTKPDSLIFNPSFLIPSTDCRK